MNAALMDRLARAPVLPLVQADDSAVAQATTQALVEGGLTVIEVVLRTGNAMACLREVVRAFPQAIVGAGTVLDAGQARESIDAGAAFLVSPGLDDQVVKTAQAASLPVLPGITTTTELQHAWNLGLRTVKFFPAEQAGGPAMLKVLLSVFPKVRFMPTGGVSAANLARYLAIPQVMACGGSWLTPAAAVAAGDYAQITRLAKEALAIAASARGTP